MQGALRLRLLGGFEVEGLDTAALGSRKARLLLKRLAVDAGTTVSVAALADAAWPDGDDPGNQIGVLVSRLRRVLGAERIVRADAGYLLVADWVDVIELEERVAAAEDRLESNASGARAAAVAALTLVRGELLVEEPDAEWAQEPRQRGTRLVRRARVAAAESALRAGRPAEAVEAAAAATAADGYDEQALRLLMRAHLAAGSPARALAAYTAGARGIADELGVDPAAETRALHEQVLHATAAGAPTPHEKPPASGDEVPSGRGAEFSRLRQALKTSSAGPSVIAVEGEPGMGKTHMLRAFAAWARPGSSVLWSVAESSRALPLEPVLEALSGAVLGRDESSRSELLGQDAALLLPLLDPATTVSGPAYRDIVAAQEPESPGAASPVLHLALLGLLTRLSRRGSVVLVIDDAQHCDPATLGWLSLLCGRGVPVLVLLGWRSGEGAAVPPFAERLALGALDLQATAELVGADRAAALHARSGGHPLFLNELAHAADGDSLPASITESVAARADACGSAAQTLRVAAVLGHTIDVDLLSSILGSSPGALLDQLEVGAARRLLADSADGYVFQHALVREALMGTVAVARRAWLHREAARVLAARPDNDPLAVAQHATQGGDRERAAAALRKAADIAGVRLDHAEALRLADASLAQYEDPQGWLVRARALLMLQRAAEAKEAADRAYDAGAGAAALEMAAHAVYSLRDLDAAVRLADLAAATTEDPRVKATCALLASRALHARGLLDDAERRLESVVNDRIGSAPTQAFASLWLGYVRLHRGDTAAAQLDIAKAGRAEEAPLPFAPLYAAQVRIYEQVLSGCPEIVLDHALRWERAIVEHGARRFEGRAGIFRGWALSLLADPAARDVLEEAKETAESRGNREPMGQGLLDLADLALRSGRLEEAESQLRRAEPIGHDAEVSNSWRIDLRRRYLAGRLALVHGEHALARQEAAAVLAAATSLGVDRYAVLARLLDAHARAVAGAVVDIAELQPDLERLPSVAAPEAWRVAAALAEALHSPQLSALSARCLDRLVDVSPHHRDTLATAGAALLSR